MNQDTENFEQLRRLLALKRHEQPPPGYFKHFSSQVILRIERGERGTLIDRLLWEAPWLQRIWAALETKPILAGVCGAAVCGLLVTGVICSDRADVSTVALVPATETESTPMALANMSVADHPLLAKPVLLEPSSTNPITPAQTDESLLGDIGKLRAQPASFSFLGGN
ncbi:MAG: hypothetical protein ABSD29_06370 [Verrucomicrobiota bacterium]|jgi:hypothetical protein